MPERQRGALRAAIQPRLSPYIPVTPTPKQAAALLLACQEVLYGGQAGGGKSEWLLQAALQYVDEPGYAALLLRRTYADLALPGALMDRAHEWLDGTDAQWHGQTYTWGFPSGATLTFGYLDSERSQYRYQSAEFQFIGFDELTQFTESQYRYLFSRLRRLQGVRVPLRMRAATNPGGVGHEWVKARFVSPGHPSRPFIPASLADNPYIDQAEYSASLERLTPLQRAWYLHGDWDAAPGTAIAERSWFPIVDAAPARAERVRFWDLAATAPRKGADPDWTVGTRMSKADGVWYIEHVVRGRWGPGAVEQVLRQTAETDGRGVQIGIEQEGGASGKLFTSNVIRSLAGWSVRALPATGDKVTRGMPFIGQAQVGNVRLVRGAWNEAWLDEITMMPNVAHDDQWDSAAGAFSLLTQRGWSRGPAA